MRRLKIIWTTFVVALGLVVSAQGATVVWGASTDNGISAGDGSTMVATGNLVRIGTFNLPDQQITDNRFDIPFLSSNFTEFATARIGDGVAGAAGYFRVTSTADATSLNLIGKQIYLWAFRSTDNSTNTQSLLTAVEHGIYYMPKEVNSRWAFPGDGIGDITTIDLSDLTNPDSSTLDAAAKILHGRFPTGPAGMLNAANFALEVPEPSISVLFGFGSLGAFIRRRPRL
jgi:PEP-CTERM motif